MARWIGLPGGAVPHDGGLALVGDADRGDVLGARGRPGQRLAADGERGAPDILGSCSTQPEAGKCCWNSCWAVAAIEMSAPEQDGAGGCRALVDGQHKGHDGFPWRCFPEVTFWAAQGSGSGGEGQVASAMLFTLPWRGGSPAPGASRVRAGRGDRLSATTVLQSHWLRFAQAIKLDIDALEHRSKIGGDLGIP